MNAKLITVLAIIITVTITATITIIISNYSWSQEKRDSNLMESVQALAEYRKKQIEHIFSKNYNMSSYSVDMARLTEKHELSNKAQWAPQTSVYYILQKRLEAIDETNLTAQSVIIKQLNEIIKQNEQMITLLKKLGKLK